MRVPSDTGGGHGEMYVPSAAAAGDGEMCGPNTGGDGCGEMCVLTPLNCLLVGLFAYGKNQRPAPPVIMDFGYTGYWILDMDIYDTGFSEVWICGILDLLDILDI